MTLKPLIALTVISLSLEPGVKGDPKKGIDPIPPKSREIQPFKKTGLAFLAKDEDQQAELFALEAVKFAPAGTPLDPEAVMAGAAPVKKAAPKPAAAATKPASKPATKPAAAPADTGKTGDESDMV